MFVGLVSGHVSVYRRDHTITWDLVSPQTLPLTCDPVTCLLPVSGAVYAASGRKIFMLDAVSNAIIRSFTANDESRACAGTELQRRFFEDFGGGPLKLDP